MVRVRFWQVTAFVTWILCMFIGLVCAITPPLNLVIVPAFLMLASGVVGAVSNKLEEAKAALHPRPHLVAVRTERPEEHAAA